MRAQSARISQLEDVVHRFQMLTDQSIGRLDGDAQRLSSGQTQIMYALNELRAARDVIFTELGADAMQAKLRPTLPDQAFGPTHAFRSRGGSGAPRLLAAGGENEYEEAPWQHRGRRGGGGGRGRRG
jgi:hypothetical protein